MNAKEKEKREKERVTGSDRLSRENSSNPGDSNRRG